MRMLKDIDYKVGTKVVMNGEIQNISETGISEGGE